MAKAVESRRQLSVRRLSEIYELSSKAHESAEARSLFLANYNTVPSLVKEFESMHLKILQDESADFDEEDAVRVRFDRMHYGVRGVYHRLTEESASVERSNVTQASSSKVKLPKISLPQFTGELSLWPSFIALFNTSIHNNVHLADIEKYQYLLASLKGDALNLVKNLPMSAEHYMIAYDTLINRYQNKRKLATHYWSSIVNTRVLKVDSAEALRSLLDTFNENLRALQLLEFPVAAWDFILFNTLLGKLTSSLREKFEAEHRKIEIPKYSQLTGFLDEYSKVFASLTGVSSSAKSSGSIGSPNSKKASSVSAFVAGTESCSLCKESHSIAKCSSFLQLSEKDRHSRARELHLCLNCLRLGHRVVGCPSTLSCRLCGAKHHTLLHFSKSVSSSPVNNPSPSISGSKSSDSTASPTKESSFVSMAGTPRSNKTVLLSTIQAEMADVHGRYFPVRILLDSASQSNFITESCVRRGGLKRSPCSMVVLGVNDAEAASAKGRTSIVIRARGREKIRMPVEVNILPKISQLQNHQFEHPQWRHLRGLQLADPAYHRPGSVDILLGAEHFVSVLREGRRRGRRGEPDALNTIFGWVLMGGVSETRVQPTHSFVSTLDQLDASLSKFWNIEEVPADSSWPPDDDHCERLFRETTCRDSSGRFIVSYPFKGDPPCFVDSRQIAVNRFRSLERRFRKDGVLCQQYREFMRDYLTKGHMELVPVPVPTDGRVFYLPHHGVSKLESETTKLRVVFDASSQCPNGMPLNQALLSGPKLQQNIVSILLRFQLGKVALTADVKQMFRQIWINRSQRDYQRIV